jgi:anti-sigma factor RsiW
MNINRNNYEEFFLLYVDNELSATERNAVELFVQENADLKEELNMLQQTVISADAIVFDKTSLLKQEFAALQENLLLYVDDELNTADKLSFEKLLKTDTAANKELALLQQTKLQPDTAIVFANKKILYRKEEGKVVGMPWRRMAAAAVVIGFGIWATVSLNSTNKATEATVATATEVKTTVPKQPANNSATNTVQTPQQMVAPATAENVIKQAPQKNNLPANNKVQQNTPQQTNDDVIAVQREQKRPSNNLPKPDYNNFNKAGSNETIIASVTPVNEATDNKNSGNKTSVAELNNDVVNGYALQTNFTESNADKDNFTEEDNAKKTKLGGFFRKVKRLVERNTNVKTGNGIKVAGFDIAIK